MPTTKVTRDALLEHAWTLFHRRGYRATSLADVAAAAGIGKAGILHHFKTKDGLMAAVIAWARERYRDYVLAAFGKTHDDGSAWTLEERLDEVFRRHSRIVQRDRGGCFFGNTILETGAGGAFAHDLHGFLADWTAAFTAALAERFPAAEATERAYRLFTDYQGAVLLYKATGDPHHLRRLRTRALASLGQSLPGYPAPVPGPTPAPEVPSAP